MEISKLNDCSEINLCGIPLFSFCSEPFSIIGKKGENILKQQYEQPLKMSDKNLINTSFRTNDVLEDYSMTNMLMEYGFIKEYEPVAKPVIVDVEFFIEKKERKIFIIFSQSVDSICRAKSLTQVFGIHHSFGKNAKLCWNEAGDIAMIVLGEMPTLSVGEMEWLVNGAFV